MWQVGGACLPASLASSSSRCTTEQQICRADFSWHPLHQPNSADLTRSCVFCCPACLQWSRLRRRSSSASWPACTRSWPRCCPTPWTRCPLSALPTASSTSSSCRARRLQRRWPLLASAAALATPLASVWAATSAFATSSSGAVAWARCASLLVGNSNLPCLILPCSATAEAGQLGTTPGRMLPRAVLTPADLPLLLVACLQLHSALLQRALKLGRSAQYQASVAAVPVAVREAAFVEAADCFCALLGRVEVRVEGCGCPLRCCVFAVLMPGLWHPRHTDVFSRCDASLLVRSASLCRLGTSCCVRWRRCGQCQPRQYSSTRRCTSLHCRQGRQTCRWAAPRCRCWMPLLAGRPWRQLQAAPTAR